MFWLKVRLSAHPSAALWNGGKKKKVKYPRTKIEFKKIKTPLSTVVVARNLHVMSSSIKKHHQKELVPVLY